MDKVFVGKGIVYVVVWKKGDERMIYNMIYLNSKNGCIMVKCFNVMSIIWMINYLLVKGLEKVKMFYFFVNFNGEVEIVYV